MRGPAQGVVGGPSALCAIDQGVAGGDGAAAGIGAVKAAARAGADRLVADKARQRTDADGGTARAIVGLACSSAATHAQCFGTDGHGLGGVGGAVVAGPSTGVAIGQGVADGGAAAAGVGIVEHGGAGGGDGFAADQTAQTHAGNADRGAGVISLGSQGRGGRQGGRGDDAERERVQGVIGCVGAAQAQPAEVDFLRRDLLLRIAHHILAHEVCAADAAADCHLVTAVGFAVISGIAPRMDRGRQGRCAAGAGAGGAVIGPAGDADAGDVQCLGVDGAVGAAQVLAAGQAVVAGVCALQAQAGQGKALVAAAGVAVVKAAAAGLYQDRVTTDRTGVGHQGVVFIAHLAQAEPEVVKAGGAVVDLAHPCAKVDGHRPRRDAAGHAQAVDIEHVVAGH